MRTGEEAGDDLYVIAVDFLDNMLVIPRTAILGVLSRLVELRRQADKPPPPWLFRTDPFWNEPAPGEDQPLRELEERAADLDQMAAGIDLQAITPDTLQDAAALVAKRRFLLLDLEAAGIFTDGFAPAKERALRDWDLPTLAGYVAAAALLHRYFRGRERGLRLPPIRDVRLLESAVSPDWFRRGDPTPPGSDPYEWLALCELAFREATLPEGPAGEIFTRFDDRWTRLRWRRDFDEIPALVGCEPMEAP